MRSLLIIAGVFLTACAGLAIYFANSDPGHEYDLKLVLPIDTRQMPKAVVPPPVTPTVKSVEPSAKPLTENRAEAEPKSSLTTSPPFEFEDRQGLPSQPRAQE